MNANKEHVPYAVGVMKVKPGMNLSKESIVRWYSEDVILVSEFEERSIIMLNKFLDYVLSLVISESKLQIIYFHNLSRFDGIFIMQHIIVNWPEWGLKLLTRNGEVYQIEVYKWVQGCDVCQAKVSMW